MSNPEILVKAIKKAITNGFVPIDVPNFDPDYFKIKLPILRHVEMPVPSDRGWPWYLIRWTDKDSGQDTEVNVEHVIFSRDFAEALWDKPTKGGAYMVYEFDEKDIPEWQYHLAQMVIADDPIEYLGKTYDKTEA